MPPQIKMEAQRNEFLELAAQNGWTAIKLDNYEFYERLMEIWCLESVWSPVGATAYVYFPIDPMSDFHNPYAWAIEISNEMPVHRKIKFSFLVPLKQWKREKDAFFTFLSDIRDDFSD